MGKLMYKGVPYSATGEVEANPQGTPSDVLDSIKINGTVYEIEGGGAATDVSYDNTTSGLAANDVQEAIDELADEKLDASLKGAANGVAELDSNSKVPKTELPTDVIYDNPIFTEANTRTNISTGESFATILGKIKKFFTDLKTVAFTGAYNDLSGTPTLGTASAKDFTTSVTQNSNDLVTSGAVFTAIDNLPEPMIFKGTLGTNGTITSLPTAATANNGYTYKVITTGTYASQPAKVGDVFTSNGTEWVYIPSGDESDTDTWRGINVNGTQLLDSGISSGNVNFKSGTNAQVSGSGNDVTVDVSTTFTEASTRTNISSGDTIATILGKIKKFFSDIKTVAFTGSYNDLSNKPTIPTVNNGTLVIKKNGASVQTFTANQSSNVEADITFPDVDDDTIKIGPLGGIGGPDAYYSTCSSVWYDSANKLLKWTSKNGISSYAIDEVPIFSGNYNDLTDTPTIPTVNNATLTIQKNGTNVQTFTSNQSTNVTANITVPTKTSDLTNDSGFITSDSDEKVKQTNTTSNADYRVLFSENANDTTQTVGARKNKDFKYNPSTGNLQVTKLNGATIGSSPKFTDTTTGTTYTAGNVPATAYFATNGSVKNVYDTITSIFTPIEVTDCLTQTVPSVFQIYNFRMSATNNPDPTVGGVIISIITSHDGACLRLLINKNSRMFTSIYIPGVTWGGWTEH